MLDPIVWLWSFADHDEPVFDEFSLRIILGDGFERLSNLNFVVRTRNAEHVSCPSCSDGHVEEVIVLDWPDGTRRYFVPCPEYLRVEVPPELLERWMVDWDALARAVAASLTLGGACTLLVEDRLWRLGRTRWRGTYRDVLFARGLSWLDASSIAQQAAHGTRPIVFVGDRVPASNDWPGRAPPVVMLSQVTTSGSSGLVVDRDAVLAAILAADADLVETEAPPPPSSGLALMIRRQIKAEEKTQLTDDILVAAYQQEGSVRKAAAFLSERTGEVVTKDKIQGAVRRVGGVRALAVKRNRK